MSVVVLGNKAVNCHNVIRTLVITFDLEAEEYNSKNK